MSRHGRYLSRSGRRIRTGKNDLTAQECNTIDYPSRRKASGRETFISSWSQARTGIRRFLRVLYDRLSSDKTRPAAQESKHSDRSRETLLPLSNALRLKIHTSFDVSGREQLVDKVRRTYSGETVLICWHHGAIPELLKAFGGDPNTASGGKVAGRCLWLADRASPRPARASFRAC
jgi:hypothetical protein